MEWLTWLKHRLATKQSTLQKVLTSAVNDLGMEAAFIGIRTHDQGPLIPQVSRGFSPREIRAILRALWAEYGKGNWPQMVFNHLRQIPMACFGFE